MNGSKKLENIGRLWILSAFQADSHRLVLLPNARCLQFSMLIAMVVSS